MEVIGYKEYGTDSMVYIKGAKKYYKCYIPSKLKGSLEGITLKYVSAKKFKTIYESEFYSRLGAYKKELDLVFGGKGEYGVFTVNREDGLNYLNSWMIMIRKEISYAEVCQEFI